MKRTFIILCILNLSIAVYSQLPTTPEVVSVSIRPLTDSVTIEWKSSPSSGVLGYRIFAYYIRGTVPHPENDSITDVDSTATKVTFKYPGVLTQPVKFWVAAYRKNTPPSSMIQFHTPIFTQMQYDACNLNVTIKWSNYVGWGSNLKYYKVFQIKDGLDIQVKGDNILPNDTILNVNVEPNKNYNFYVCAINANPTITSFSNSASCFTKSEIPPKYIIANYASFNPNSNNPVNLKFKVDTAAQIKKYQLYASDNFESGFLPLNDPMIATKDSVVIQDNTIGSTPRYYRLEALNFCGHSVAQSNTATAVILKLAARSDEINLVWNDYKGWYQGVAQYNIYRKIGNDEVQLIKNTGVNDFTDNVSSLVGKQFSGNICYFVEAVSKSDNSGNVYHSFSSNNCIDLSEAVFVPEGFTPNGDGINDEFKPSFAFLPNEFVMVVYNRYGFKIFETKEPLKGWDGTIGGGQKAPEGTYVYFIKFSSQTGKTVEKKGNFSLIYP